MNHDQYYYNTQINGPLDRSMFTPTQFHTQEPQFLDPEMESETEHDSEDEEPLPTQHAFGDQSQSLFPDESQIQRHFAQSRKTKIDNEVEKYKNISSTYFSTCKFYPFFDHFCPSDHFSNVRFDQKNIRLLIIL